MLSCFFFPAFVTLTKRNFSSFSPSRQVLCLAQETRGCTSLVRQTLAGLLSTELPLGEPVSTERCSRAALPLLKVRVTLQAFEMAGFKLLNLEAKMPIFPFLATKHVTHL